MNNVRKNIPSEIREMLLAITRVFYEPTETAVLNILISHNYLSEQELVNISEFDFNMLRTSLNKLIKDKLIDKKMQVSTDENGKTINTSYYYINFKQALNSFMYRLENCFKKLEEAQSKNMTSGDYCCSECGQTYTDLDVMPMFNLESDCIECRLCLSVVLPVEDKEKRLNAREEIARFNTKIHSPFVALFHKCKQHLLAADMIRPDFKDPNATNDGSDNLKPNNASAIKNDSISINFNPNATWNDSFHTAERETKSNPAWLSSNVANNYLSNNNQSDQETKTENTLSSKDDSITLTMAPGRVPGAVTTVNSSIPVADVMSVLLANEYCVENSLRFYARDLPFIPIQTNFFYLTVRGKSKDIRDITEEMLELMSEDEIRQFQLIGQRLHEYCYDSNAIF